MKSGETSIAVFRHHVPLHTILSTKRFFTDRTEQSHVNSSGAECRLRKRKNVEHLYRFSGHKILLFSLHHHHNHISIVFSPPPPPHFYCFPSTTTTTATTFLLFSLHHRYHISIVVETKTATKKDQRRTKMEQITY